MFFKSPYSVGATYVCRFVQTWVFKGVCHDMFGEFMIEMDEQYLAYRGKYNILFTSNRISLALVGL